MDECLRAEARVLILDRTPWHMTWVGVRPQRARRQLDGARVSARGLPVERSRSCRRRAPRHGCQPCLRGSRLSSRVPSALSLSASRLGWRHPLDEGSPADGNVSRAGDECGGVGVGTEAPLRRSEVGRRPSRVRSDMPHAPRKRGWQAPLARPARDATPPSYLYSTNEKVKRSYRPGGQGRRAGGRAGSGETIPSGVSPPDPPSERPTPYPGSEHSWFTGQSGDPLGGGPSHDCPVGPGMAVASHSGAE